MAGGRWCAGIFAGTPARLPFLDAFLAARGISCRQKRAVPAAQRGHRTPRTTRRAQRRMTRSFRGSRRAARRNRSRASGRRAARKLRGPSEAAGECTVCHRCAAAQRGGGVSAPAGGEGRSAHRAASAARGAGWCVLMVRRAPLEGVALRRTAARGGRGRGPVRMTRWLEVCP